MADDSYTLDDLHIDNDLGGDNSSRGGMSFKKQGVLPDTVVTTAKEASADPLANLKMLNVGVGAGVYKDRIDNTFLFKSIKAGTDILIDVSNDEITINSTATGGGGSGVDEFFELTDVPAKAGQDGKVLGLVAGALAWVNLPTGGSGVTQFNQLTDVPASYAGQAGKFVAVKTNETGLEYVSPPTGGGGSGNTTRYEATIAFGPNNEPTVSDLPAGWTFNIDPDVPSRVVITHTTGKIPYGVSILAYQDAVAALTPLGTGLFRISMDQATLTTKFMINFPNLSTIGGSANSIGKLFFLF